LLLTHLVDQGVVMHDTRSYKIFQGGYVIPAKDDRPADYVKAKPPVFHCQVFNGKQTTAFFTRKTYAEAKREGEESMKLGS